MEPDRLFDSIGTLFFRRNSVGDLSLNFDSIHGPLLVIAWLYKRSQRGEWAAQDLALDDTQAI